jgi:hypothetical protein
MLQLQRSGVLWLLAAGCAGGASPRILVTNELDTPRACETICVPWGEVQGVLGTDLPPAVEVIDETSGEKILSQIVDGDGDGTPDELLFQAGFAPKESRRYRLVVAEASTLPEPTSRTFGRHVPERSDDFAWENDLVAFRMYGPALAADAVNSGVDCWLKRVSYPIIDKWYAGNLEGKSYHQDHGEGYDPYHVGGSRGCGGLAVWHEGRTFPSDVYAEWKVIEDGPIRTTFELTYAPWEVAGRQVEEIKRISIDLGSRLSRFESVFRVDGRPAVVHVAIGITTHGGAGRTGRQPGSWIYCWEEIDESGLGTGVVIPDGVPSAVELSSAEDEHVVFLADTDAGGRIHYWAGYGWERAGAIVTELDWAAYLLGFAAAKQSPLRIEVKP